MHHGWLGVQEAGGAAGAGMHHGGLGVQAALTHGALGGALAPCALPMPGGWAGGAAGRAATQLAYWGLQMRDWWDEKRQAQNAETLRT